MQDPQRDAGAVIVYGAIGDPGIAMAQELAVMEGAGRRLSPRLAVARPGQPALRLNSRGWANLDPQTVTELATHDGRVGFCTRTLLHRAPLFAGPVRDFIPNYLAFIGEAVERQRPVLQEKFVRAGLPESGGLLNVSDWFFSAYLPLPNAHVLVGGTDENSPVFVRVDCAFWTGKELIVVLFDGLTMPPPSQARALARLMEIRPDLRVVRARPAPRGVLSAFTEELGETLGSFADECALPYGLFRLAATSHDL